MKNTIGQTFVTALIFLSTIFPALARPWYYPEQLSKDTINPYLTIDRLADSSHSRWDGQLVFWEGIVEQQSDTESNRTLILKCGSKRIPVRFTRPVRNLDSERNGYRVAIKGILRISDSVPYLDGKSVVLLVPPLSQSFASWIGTDPADLPHYIAWRAAFHQPKLTRERVLLIGETLVKSAKQNGIDPLLFAAQIQIESCYDYKAVSVSGAQGLGQLMPFTARDLHVADPFDPVQNLLGSARYVGSISRTWSSYPNRDALTLASYNAGPNAVRRHNCHVPPYPETVNYVYFIGLLHKIMQNQTQAFGLK